MKLKKGFTLIELMVVIGLMSILLLIGVQSFRKAREQSLLASCMESMKTILTSIELYKADGRDALPPESLPTLVPDYVRNLPVIHQTGADYGYLEDPNTKTYTIYCEGINHPFLNIPEDYPRLVYPGGMDLGK